MVDKNPKNKPEKKPGVNVPPVLPGDAAPVPEVGDVPIEIVPEITEIPPAELPEKEPDPRRDLEPPTETNADRDQLPFEEDEGAPTDPL